MITGFLLFGSEIIWTFRDLAIELCWDFLFFKTIVDVLGWQWEKKGRCTPGTRAGGVRYGDLSRNWDFEEFWGLCFTHRDHSLTSIQHKTSEKCICFDLRGRKEHATWQNWGRGRDSFFFLFLGTGAFFAPQTLPPKRTQEGCNVHLSSLSFCLLV